MSVDYFLQKGAQTPAPVHVFSETVKVNFAEYLANVGAAVPTTSVVKLFNVAAETTVIGIITKVLTAEGGALTGDIGDGTTTNGYDNDVDLNAATTAVCPHTTDGTDASAYKYYSAADTIDLVLTGAADAAIVEFTMLAFRTKI